MTARVGAPVHPEVASLLARVLPAATAAAALLTERPIAVVIMAGEHPKRTAIRAHLGHALRQHVDGNGYAAAPLATVQALADELAPDVAPALREPVSAGEVWCLVLRSPVGSAAVPVTPYVGRGSKAVN